MLCNDENNIFSISPTIVFSASHEEFDKDMSQQRNVHQENVLRLRGLPWNSTKRDIADFFQGNCIRNLNLNANFPCS